MNRRRRIAALVVATITALLAAATVVVIVAARRQPNTRAPVAPLPAPIAPAPGVSMDDGRSYGPPLPPLPAPPPTPPATVGLVISAGGNTYVALDTSDIPNHRAPQMVESVAVTAVASVAARDVPVWAREWQRAGVTVDGECHARVTGFAVIARVRGVARDADEELTEWTADSVMSYGSKLLAARITGCTGTFARPTTLEAIEVFTESSEVLVGDARERFVASQPFVDAQRDWQAAGNEGDWYEAFDARFDTGVFAHPRTGVTWIVVNAYLSQDCGQAGGNVLGLYRVEANRTLTQVQLRGGNADRVTHMIDIDRDGEPELVSASETAPSIDRANGETIVSVAPPSEHGCGC